MNDEPGKDRRRVAIRYALSLAVVAVCTLVGQALAPLVELTNIAMIYMLGVVVVATRLGRGPSFFATVMGVAAFDYLYVPPQLSFVTTELKYFVMFAVMLVTGFVIGGLTERLRNEVKASERLAAQVDFERQRNTLLSSVSHDFRTPLATVTAASSALLDESTHLDAEATRELLTAIFQESTRVERLVANLLQMTRLDSDRVMPRLEEGQVEEIIGEAAGRFPTDLESGRIQLNLPDDLPACRFDRDLFELALVNLIENALKYSKEGEPIQLEARRLEGAVRVDVLDRGDGIPEADRSGMFEKFQRLPNARGKSGVGLGLAICRAAMEAQGGHVKSEPRSGGGSAFFLELPIVSSA